MEPLRIASFARRDRTVLAGIGVLLIVSTVLFAGATAATTGAGTRASSAAW